MSLISPRARRNARERAMQFLFGLDFTGYDWQDVLEKFWENNAARKPVRDYAERLIRGVVQRRDELDVLINGALDRWSPERVGRIERNVLRIALYEMRHGEDVPPGVAINEALEVAREFGANDSVSFVNAVLDRLKDS